MNITNHNQFYYSMKTRSLSITVFVSLLLVSLFGGCKGEKGDVGPQGETGEQGPGGVIYSKWESYTGWSTQNLKSRRKEVITGYKSEFDMSKDILLVYMAVGAGNYVNLLPSVSTSLSFNFYDARYVNNSINYRLIAETTEPSLSDSFVNALKFRWVIIRPSGDPYGRKAAIDYADYEAVKKAYNIPD